MPNIALISDASHHRTRIAHVLHRQTYQVDQFPSKRASEISSGTDIIYAEAQTLADLHMIKLLRERLPLVPIVMFTDTHNAAFYVESLRAGVSDILHLVGTPDDDNVEIAESLYRTLKQCQHWVEVDRLYETHRDVDITTREDADTIQHFQQAVIFLDRQGRITSVNKAAEEMLQKTEMEMIRRDIGEYIGLKDEDKRSALAFANSVRGEMKYIRGGEKITIGYTLNPKKTTQAQGGEITGAVLMLKDITEDKAVRTKIEKAEKIQTLGDIAAAISHEVKNPLAAIKSMVQALMMELKPDDEHLTSLGRITKEVDRINSFIESTFAFARKKRQRMMKVNIHTVLHAVTSLLAENFKAKGILLVQNYNNDIPEIKIDPDQIQRVFLNLLLNAIDAVPANAGKKIEIASAMKTEKVFTRNNNPFDKTIQQAVPKDIEFVEVSVKDEGVGISDEAIAKIFDPFFTTKPTGTGLGLAISYKTVEEHDGKIEVFSEVGKGTTFVVKLPLHRAART
jgi:PAS domain S-box-containing protein